MEGLWDFRSSQGATSNTSYARVTLHDSHWSYLTWSGEWPHHTAHSILTKTGSVIGCCLREGRASGCLSRDMSRVMSHSAKKLWIEIMILPCQTSCVVVVRREDHFTMHYVFWCQEGGNLTLAFSSVCRCFQIVDGTEQHRFFTHVAQSLKAHVTSSLMNIWFGSCDSLAHLLTQAKSDHFTMPPYNIYGSLTFWCIKSYWTFHRWDFILHVIPLWTCRMQVPNACLPGSFWHFALQLLKSHPVASSVLQKDF